MQIAGINVIKDQEKKFIDSIADSLDWNAIKDLLTEKYQVEITGEPDYKTGEFLINDSGIGYKFDFDVKILLQLSISCDRNGNCIKISSKASEKSIINDGSSEDPFKEANNLNASSGESDNSVNNNFFDSKESENQTEKEADINSTRNISNMASQIATMIDEINS